MSPGFHSESHSNASREPSKEVSSNHDAVDPALADLEPKPGMRGVSMRNSVRTSLRPSTRERKEEDVKPCAVMVDADAMKRKVRENLAKPKKHINYYKDDGIAAMIVKSPRFEQITLAIITFNALWIAVDTDLNKEEMLVNAHPIFIVVENSFCTFFSFELVARFTAFKWKRNCVKDPWFVFDSMLVMMMILETWVMTAIVLLAGGDSSSNTMGNASILRIARLMRLSRMARMARLLRAMPELMIMIKGMLAATRSVFFTLCLLAIIMYIFAITFTQLTANTNIGSKHYGTVPDSMYTLLIHGTLLDEVGKMAHEMEKEETAPVLIALFFFFILMAALTVMNMLVGVLCEVVSAVAATEREEMLVSYVNQKLQAVVSLLDQDGDNVISKKEFVGLLENVDAARALHDVGVDVIGLVDFAEFIFEDDSVTQHGVEKELSFSEFMQVVLQLRGTNNSTVKDIVDLRKFIRNALIETNHSLKQILSIVSVNGESHIASPSTHSSPRPSSTEHKSRKPQSRRPSISSISSTLLPTVLELDIPESEDFPTGPKESDEEPLNFHEWSVGLQPGDPPGQCESETQQQPLVRHAETAPTAISASPHANIVAALRGKWFPVEVESRSVLEAKETEQVVEKSYARFEPQTSSPVLSPRITDRRDKRRSVPWGHTQEELFVEPKEAKARHPSKASEIRFAEGAISGKSPHSLMKDTGNKPVVCLVEMDQLVKLGQVLTADELEQIKSVLQREISVSVPNFASASSSESLEEPIKPVIGGQTPFHV